MQLLECHTAFLLECLWWLPGPPTKIHPVWQPVTFEVWPLPLSLPPLPLLPTSTSYKVIDLCACACMHVCAPRLCFTWASLLLFCNSCLLSEWGTCPLSSLPVTAWSYLSLCLFIILLYLSVWAMSPLDYVTFLRLVSMFNLLLTHMPDTSQLLNAQSKVAEWLNISA